MIRSLIVDDEPIALRVLSAHLGKIPDVEIVAGCTNAVEAIEVVRSEAVDLVFLDIEMPELTGIGFVEALADPPRFVFTTAHRDYAVRGFELDAVDYLLKPIGFPRLLRAVEKYRRLDGQGSAGAAGQAPESAPEPINIQVDRRTLRIDPREIVYVESLSDYVIFHTETDRYTSKMRLSDVADELAAHGFLRIHRSYVVASRRVEAFTSGEVQLGATVLPISRTYRERAMEMLRKGGLTGS